MMNKQKIKIPNGDNLICGTLYLPERECSAGFPLIIMSHGFNGSGDDFVNEAECFAHNEIAVFTLDFCGGSCRSASTGKTTDMTIFSEKSDLLCTYNFLKGRSEIDKDKIFLFGGSMGGLVTALIADELEAAGEKIAGVVMYFPAFCIADDWRKHFPDVAMIPDTYDMWGMMLGKGFFETIHDYDVYKHIGGFQREVLIIHGDRDEIVPLECSQRAVKLYPKAALTVLENEGHGFSPEGAKTACGKVLDFIKNIIAD